MKLQMTGAMNRYLSDGGTALHVDGGEYDRVYPVWNFSRPPGATVAVGAPPPDCKHTKAKTTATFVGSASDGEFGSAAQTLRGSSTNAGGRDVDANKSWLMFDSAIVCRGFTQEDAVTTIEQSNLRGEVTYSQDGGLPHTLGSSQRSFDLSAGAVWIYHRNTGYLLPRTANATAHLSATIKRGSWSLLGPDAESGATPLPDNGAVALPVYDLYIEHGGRAPDAPAYSYTVLPGAAAAAMQHLAETAGGLIVSGEEAGSRYHAAVDAAAGVLLGVAWDATTIELAGWQVAASMPSAFVLRWLKNGTISGSASIPDRGGELQLKVAVHGSRPEEGGGEQSCALRFALSTGEELGKSVLASCNLA